MALSSSNQCSILHLLMLRAIERNDCKIERWGGKIMRSVIIQKSVEFHPVWSKACKKSICIGLDRRVYFDKYQTCFFVEGFGGKPRELYKLPTGQLKIDINSMILYNCHLRMVPTTTEEQRPCLLVQTSDGWLKLLDACTGELLRSIFISSIIKFSSIDWADYYQTVQLKSTINQTRRPRNNEAAPTISDRLLTMYIFKIHPLELVGSFNINRSVFGDKIRDVELSEDVLVVSNTDNTFQFYSFRWILEHCTVLRAKLGERVEVEEGRCGIVGELGFGVPITINLRERPPLLFTTRSSLSYGVQFGGSPAVYCHNAVPKLHDEFHIKTLVEGHLVAELKTDSPTMNDDVANFHFDNYQRFIHIHGCTFRDGVPNKLEKEYSVDFKQESSHPPEPEAPFVTQSGRVVRRRRTLGGFEDLSSSLHKVELEDEVDLVYAVVTLPAGGDDLTAYIFFLDDKTGTILKKVEIPTWKQV